MTIKLEGEYHGYLIQWQDWNKTFIIRLNGLEVKAAMPNIESCEKWIDTQIKTKFKSVP